MQVASAYIFVVLVWSTTPLAIKMSNSSLSFVSAVSLRMVLAFIICYAILLVLNKPLIKRKSDWAVYAVSSLGLFPNMLLIYWAAQFLPSGLMSVLMGFYPFCAGIGSWILLKENPFTPSRIIALLMAITGLACIHFDQMQVGKEAFWGALCLLLACVIWALSSVLVKKLGSEISPLRMGAGSILVSLPFFMVCWFLIDGELPKNVGTESVMAVAYLVVVGSVLSHTLYFYILRCCTVSTVALVTLITPVMAIALGIAFAGEVLSFTVGLGSFLIIVSLAVYQGALQKVVAWIKSLRLFRVDSKAKLQSVQARSPQ